MELFDKHYEISYFTFVICMVVHANQIVKIFVPEVGANVGAEVVLVDRANNTAIISVQGCEKEVKLTSLGEDPP
jgi:hypothetical protein